MAQLQCMNDTSLTSQLPFVKLVFELSAPNRLPTCPVSQGISGLNHESFDNPMEDKIIIISISAMCGEIFNCFGTFFWIQFHKYITHGCMHDLQKKIDVL